ncbi:MAG: hypothetical protein ACP5E9_10090 [Candidatus Methanospirareceae archaeon]
MVDIARSEQRFAADASAAVAALLQPLRWVTPQRPRGMRTPLSSTRTRYRRGGARGQADAGGWRHGGAVKKKQRRRWREEGERVADEEEGYSRATSGAPRNCASD